MKDSVKCSESVASASASRWLASLALMAGTALSAPALACPPEDSEGEHQIHLRVAPRPDSQHLNVEATLSEVPVLKDLPMLVSLAYRAEPSSTIEMSHSVNGKSFEVRIEDGNTTAKIDGKEIPGSRIRSTEGKITLLDADGNVAHTFSVPDAVGSSWSASASSDDKKIRTFTTRRAPQAYNQLRFEPGEGVAAISSYTPVAPPPVMMGITMSEAADEAGAGIVVDKVMDGLPASKAGLKVGDKIVSVNDTEMDSVLPFREYLRERKAGETIALRVLRDGKELDLKITLEAYNAKTLDPLLKEVEEMMQAENGIAVTGTITSSDAWYSDARRAIEEARKSLKDSKISDAEREKAELTLNNALKSLDVARERHAPLAFGKNRYFDPSQPGVLIAPKPPSAMGSAVNTARADELDAKVDRLAAQLDKVMAAIEAQKAGGIASKDAVDQTKAIIERLKRENEAQKKKIEELEAKSGGN